DEALADAALGHRETGAHLRLAGFQHLAGRTPGQELGIARYIIDQVIQRLRRVRQQRRALNMRRHAEPSLRTGTRRVREQVRIVGDWHAPLKFLPPRSAALPRAKGAERRSPAHPPVPIMRALWLSKRNRIRAPSR